MRKPLNIPLAASGTFASRFVTASAVTPAATITHYEEELPWPR
jgi:hypothetical protein